MDNDSVGERKRLSQIGFITSQPEDCESAELVDLLLDSIELELELILSQKAQKPMLRG